MQLMGEAIQFDPDYGDDRRGDRVDLLLLLSVLLMGSGLVLTYLESKRKG